MCKGPLSLQQINVSVSGAIGFKADRFEGVCKESLGVKQIDVSECVRGHWV